MKKIISMLMAAASFAALADATATYQRLSWKVSAQSISAVDAKFVNLYAEVGGVRVGSDGRVSSGAIADTGLSTVSVIVGEGGWDWTGKNITEATFAVEYLNNSLGVIATSDAVSYDDLVDADAFEINYTGSAIPQNGITAYAFDGVNVGTDGVYEYLKGVFDADGKVIPVADSDGNIVDYYIALSNDITGPLSLNANLGKLTLDLQGHSITGTNAVSGVASVGAGGQAIVITGELATSLRGATDLEIVSDPPTGYAGVVAGGNGADALTGTKGGYALYSDVAGVKVTVGDNVTFQAGKSGNSVTGAAVAGQSAVNTENVTVTGVAKEGQTGTIYDAWAWANCTGPVTADQLPVGTYFDGSKLWFFRRTADATNPTARATFDFCEVYALADIAGLEPAVHFVDKKILVDNFTLGGHENLTFVGEANTVIAASGLKSAFNMEACNAAETHVWTNLAFTCEMPAEAWDLQGATSFDGGAIHACYGAFRVIDCSFSGLSSTQLGGAICAEKMEADSEIVSCTFDGNGSLAINEAGGAIYASASQAGVTLSVVDSTFTDNAALDGGAISTETVVEGDVPLTLDVSNSLFAGNWANSEGGAIFAEGSLFVDKDATLETPGTTVFSNNFASVVGGAISLNGIDGDTEAATLKMRRGVQFVDNMVSNAVDYAAGGAIYSYTLDETIDALGVKFVGNVVYGVADYGVSGGAVMNDSGTNVFDTCVFDGNRAVPLDNGAYYYGGALVTEHGTLALKNCSFRNQNIEAVDVYESALSVTNCVIVGNSVDVDPLSELADVDIISESSTVALAYSAWQKVCLDTDPIVDEWNLTNRTTEIYASDDSLHLRETGFNAVAAFGLEQPGVYDFDGVEYGSKSVGSSMGAFEAGTTPATVNVNGVKTYDGYANSNGCVWTFTTLDDDPDFSALGPVESLVTVTNWWFGNRNAGEFAATNAAPQNLIAAVDGNTEEIRRWIETELLQFTYDGEIERRDIAEGGLTIELTPDEYPYTGSEVQATVVVTDTLVPDTEVLASGTDYTLVFADNVNPTASAKVTVDMLKNFIGDTNLFYAITAYFVEYLYDGKVDESATKTIGETSGVAVVTAEVPEVPGYAFDLYYSPTNGIVRRADDDNGLLRLQVLYCIDENGDNIPDKYQRKILAKVVKGEWSQDIDGNAVKNGTDVELWSTLWKDGKWSADGTGVIDSGIPTATTRPDGGYSAGGWLGFDASGSLVKVDDPATFEFSTAKIPFLIYAYSHSAGTTAQSSGRGRTSGGKTGTGTTATQKDLLEQYSALMTVADATFTGTQLKLKTKLVINGPDASSTDVPVSDTELKLYFVEKLGDDWQSQPCVTDDEGVITVDLSNQSGFYKVGL